MALSKNQLIAVCAVVIIVIAAAAAAVMMNNGGGDDSGERESSYENGPVTVTTFTDYNGNTADITFYDMPERIVVGCNTALSLFLYLGLGDRIVGVYYNEEPVWDEVADEYAELVERIGEVDASGSRNLSQNISTDVLLDWQPDMVIGWVSWNDDGLGSVDFFSRNGINVMSFNAMTSSEYRNLESVKTDFDNIGNIFEIRDKTDALYNQITGEVDDIRDDLSDILGAGESVTYCIIDGALDPDTATIWAYGDTNFLAGILNTIGMTNVFPAGGSSIGLDRVYEAIATQGIDIIIFITYDNVSLETSVQSWLDNPTLSSCDAIRNGDYFGTKLSVSYGSSPELLDYLEFIRDYVRGMGA